MPVYSFVGSKLSVVIMGGGMFCPAFFNSGFAWFLIVTCHLEYVMSIVVATSDMFKSVYRS